MKTRTFDQKFDTGEDISHHLDVSKSMRPNRAQKRVNVDFPNWMVAQLDQEASRLGVTRQSVIKMWLSERLDQSRAGKAALPSR